VFKPALIVTCLAVGFCFAQQAEKAEKPERPEQKAQSAADQPKVKVNYLNVCAPPAEDQAEIKSAFAKIPARPAFGPDFEISRGHATLQESPDSRFVRLRRDMAVDSPFLTAQYSISRDNSNIIETLVLRTRDAKQFHEISLEDRVSSGAASPATVLSVETPVSRIRLERFTKNSIVLARCPEADQNAYEPLFREASDVMARYRKALGLATTFRSDLNWLTTSASPVVSKQPLSSKSVQKKQP
jgi:hypothetical protein